MGKGDIDDLTTKFAVGSNANANKTYKNVNYRDMKLKLQEEKLKLKLDRHNLKKFNKIKSKYGSTSTYNQHKSIWLKEDISLKSQVRTISAVIAEQADPSKLLCENEICEFVSELQSEFKVFEASTVQPVWEFIGDMEFWFKREDRNDNTDDVGPILESIAGQQGNILDNLLAESQKLESELEVFNGVLKSWEYQSDNTTETLFSLRFPREECLYQYIEQYLTTDKQYNDALHELKLSYDIILHKGRFGGWPREEHALFEHISHMYPVDKHQRSTLSLEMLRKSLSHRTEDELREHQEWCQLHALYTEHKRTIKRMHTAALQKLVSVADTDCREQWRMKSEVEAKTAEVLQQKERTAKKFEELLKAREERLVKLRVEEEELAVLNERMRKEREDVERRREKQRQMEKEKIAAFQAAREEHHQANEQKLAELREKDARNQKKRLVAGKKRVNYRADLQAQKLEEQAAEQARKEHEEMERKERLDKLAATVAVEAPYDPLRVLNYTEASVSKVKKPDYTPNNPLFSIVGYDDGVIQKDMRLKVEKALRNAGLMNTDYGRSVLTSIAPPVAPRPDMVSTVFKQDEG
eukprot:sb/3463330/